MGLLDGFYSLSADVNKVKSDGDQGKEGALKGELLPELKLSMSDEDLIKLKDKWLRAWAPQEKELRKTQERNKKYWQGLKVFDDQTQTATPSGDTQMQDNLIFECVEEFLPQATKQNPEPVVTTDNTPDGIALSDKIGHMLSYIADQQKLKLHLKQVMRMWALNRLGVAKVGWSVKKNDVTLIVVRPQKLILDPHSTIINCEYTGEYIGEYKEEKASDLIARFPDKKSIIKEEVKDELGSKIKYIEWWTNEYLFWTMKNEVLGKVKNPHWNYEEQKPIVDENGNSTEQTIPGKNHFPNPQKPYLFLSIFNTLEKPFDDTSLIEQVIPLQDLINKRVKQIDKNADNTNGCVVVSGDHFSKEQAAKVSLARRNGDSIWVPTGNVGEAIKDLTSPPLAPFIYQSVLDYRNEVRGIFGVRGISGVNQTGDRTVRGKIVTRQQDMDRIGGGVSEYLEQFADSVFNWWVQLMYVYYTEDHIASVIGREKAVEYITLRSQDINRKLNITVKEGSMLPKDSMSKRNEAIDLWSAGALDPITLFERLDFPNPRESAMQLFLWLNNPQALFQETAPPGAPPQPQPTPAQPIPSQTPPPPQPGPSILSQVPLNQAGK